MTQNNTIIQSGDTCLLIRSAQPEDKNTLSALAYRAYKNRFFNDEVTDKVGGSLKKFPDLVPDDQNGTGQNLAYFQKYWDSTMPRLNDENADPEFTCYVAELLQEDGTSGPIIGFIKGDSGSLDSDLYSDYEKENEKRLQQQFNACAKKQPIALPDSPTRIAELGSLYIDPNYQFTKVGRALTQTFTVDMLNRGYDAMVTRCYSENNSQGFFEKMGADLFTTCDIPQTFENGKGTQGDLTLPGETLYWSKAQMTALTQTDVMALPRGQRVEASPEKTRQRNQTKRFKF